VSLARRTILGVFLVLPLAGCLTHSLPIPPPSAAVQAVTVCEPAVCPNGGVTVTLGGSAAIGALVIVEDTNPLSLGPRGEALVAGARATADGSWRVILAPQRDGAAVRSAQRGDVLNVYQVTAEGEASQSVFVQVPR
jgi:hypothetical protein